MTRSRASTTSVHACSEQLLDGDPGPRQDPPAVGVDLDLYGGTVGREALCRKVIAHISGKHRDHQRHDTAMGEHEDGLAPVGVGDIFEGLLEPLDDGVAVLASRIAGVEIPLQPCVDNLVSAWIPALERTGGTHVAFS